MRLVESVESVLAAAPAADPVVDLAVDLAADLAVDLAATAVDHSYTAAVEQVEASVVGW